MKESYETEVKEAESLKLKKLVESLSDKERDEIYQRGLQLQAEQNTIQNGSCLPTVTISDVNRNIKPTVVNIEHSEGVPIQYCQQPTNGMTYFRALSGCEDLPIDLQPYLPLFTEVITRMGAGGMDHRIFAEQCDLYTGGSLSVGTHVVPHHTKRNHIEQAVSFSSYCLDRHLHHKLSLWEDVFTEPDLQDLERLRTLVTMAASSLSMAVADSGHSFAMMSSASSLSPSAMLSEKYGGISQVKFMKEVAEEADLSDVLRKLSLITVHVMDTGCMRCAINTTPDHVPIVSNAMDGFIDTIPGGATDTMDFMKECDHTPTSRHTHYCLPFPVYYVGQSYGTVPYTHEDSPRLLVLARLLSWKYLHKEIREKGGAYGGGAKHGNGIFSFYSYRDPNSLATVGHFHDSIQWALNGTFTQQDIDEAKLSVFSQVDSPVAPSAKGSSIFYNGVTDDLKQQHRDRLFRVNKEDLINVAKRYLSDVDVKGTSIIGPDINNLPSNWTVESFKL